MKHCRHCTDPGSPAHDNPAFREAEETCAFYEDPQHLEIAGPPRASHFLRSGIALREAARAFAAADADAGNTQSEDRADAFAALVSAADYYLSLAKERAAKRRGRDDG